jgi:hypothetical protein
MTNSLLFISNYVIAIGVVAQLALLTLQLKTYRKTGHSSLRTISFATVFGLLYIAVFFAARKFWATGHNPLSLYVLAAALVTLQSVVGIIGVRSLFRAFERAMAPSL